MKSQSDHLERIMGIARHKKILDLRGNIAALSKLTDFSFIDTLTADGVFLQRLKNQLGEVKLGNIQTLTDFEDEQLRKRDKIIFGNNVSQLKLKKLQSEFNENKKELELLTSVQLAKAPEVQKIKNDLAFLKILEAKQLSLKLLNSSLTSDLMFEEAIVEPNALRSFDLVKVLVLFLVVGLPVALVFVIINFAFDDRIYSRDELCFYFSSTDFIGEVPSFED